MTDSSATERPLEVVGLDVQFGGTRALAGVDLRVEAGTVHALIGPNGAGKSTVLNAVSLLVPRAAGTMAIVGRDAAHLRAHDLAVLGVARTFQSPAVVEDVSAVDNVALGLYASYRTRFIDDTVLRYRARRKWRERHRAARQALAEVGLGDVADRPAGDLPYGVRKLLDVARVWAARPRLAMLDEPTSGLDSGEIEALGGLFRRFAGTCGILVVAHHVDFVMKVADTVTVLDYGRVIAKGAPVDVARDPVVVESYLGSEAPLAS